MESNRTELTGYIIDGSGKPGFFGRVVVEGDKISEVAETAAPEGLKASDAVFITPGFIDSHSHSDAYLILEPDAPSKLSQGITTEINGQCGGSIVPRYGEARLSSDWKALLGDRLTWHTLAEYREVLEAAHPAINTVQFIGHNTLRSSVIGYANEKATPMTLGRMSYLLEQALDEGGKGLTTGLIYPPGKYSDSAEVEALAQVVAKRGGYYATHMRSEGDAILEAIDEVLKLVRNSGIKAEISHLKTSGEKNWSKIDAVLEKIEGAVEEGLLLGSDRYPYCAAGTDLDIVIEDDGTIKDRDWSKVMIGGTWHEDNKRYSGRLVSEILKDEGANASEFIKEVVKKDGGKTGAFFFSMNEENLKKIYSREWIVPGSDASLRAPWGPLAADFPHPRAYSTMPEFYRQVRGLGFSREQAVARMTGVPARRFGLKGRGILEKGAFADLVVWKESEFKGNATFAEPHQFASGVSLVMVNGTISYRDGKFTGERGGRFLD